MPDPREIERAANLLIERAVTLDNLLETLDREGGEMALDEVLRVLEERHGAFPPNRPS